MSESGYTHCACSTCFEIAVSSDMSKPELCSACEESGCDGDGECLVEFEDEEGVVAG